MASRFWLSLLLLATAWLDLPMHVSAASISAWYSSPQPGPQVLMYDATSGSITYSLCNSGETPIFPGNTSLQLEYAPINGTSIAAVGYVSGNITAAVVHYQEQGGGIVQALFVCNYSNGYWEPNVGNFGYTWIVSGGVLPSIYAGTDLAVVNLGADPTEGFRVYYKTAELQTAVLKYTSTGNWAYDGYVTQYNSSAIGVGATLTGESDIMVVVAFAVPQSSDQPYYGVEYCMANSSALWSIDGLPYSLAGCTNSSCVETVPLTNQTNGDDYYVLNSTSAAAVQLDAFVANSSYLSVSLDSEDNPSIFYIGTDRVPHQIRDLDGIWQNVGQQDTAQWPPADNINADFSVAYDQYTDRVWVFYVSNGSLGQAYQSDNTTWEKFTTLPTANATVTPTGSSSGLSEAAKVGLGVGVGIGIPVLVAVLVFIIMRSTRRSRGRGGAKNTATGALAEVPGSDAAAPQYTAQQWSSTYGAEWVQKPEQTTVHEMANYGGPFELRASGGPQADVAEMPAGEDDDPGPA